MTGKSSFERRSRCIERAAPPDPLFYLGVGEIAQAVVDEAANESLRKLLQSGGIRELVVSLP